MSVRKVQKCNFVFVPTKYWPFWASFQVYSILDLDPIQHWESSVQMARSAVSTWVAGFFLNPGSLPTSSRRLASESWRFDFSLSKVAIFWRHCQMAEWSTPDLKIFYVCGFFDLVPFAKVCQEGGALHSSISNKLLSFRHSKIIVHFPNGLAYWVNVTTSTYVPFEKL